MSKPYEFNWRPLIPDRLLKGEIFDRWEEETGILEENVLFRVDEYGFFLYWQPEGKVSSRKIKKKKERLLLHSKNLKYLFKMKRTVKY